MKKRIGWLCVLLAACTIGGCAPHAPPPSPVEQPSIPPRVQQAMEEGRRYDRTEILQQLRARDPSILSIEQVLFYPNDQPSNSRTVREGLLYCLTVTVTYEEPLANASTQTWHKAPMRMQAIIAYYSGDRTHFKYGSGRTNKTPKDLVLTLREP